MGTWDIGPFDNDTAADFAHTLDETAEDEREGLVRATLTRAVRSQDHLEGPEGDEAVAAAALVAAQCPGGEPVCAVFGPEDALPVFAAGLRPLAVEALDRVVAEASELAELWDEAPDGPKWREVIGRLRDALDPPVPPQEDVLFETVLGSGRFSG
ncbi:DUF4259 domain-containing protein [Streptomyces sp. CB03238]|uniref:DUF4259 domain-containing protein n=1 Tax=Streptomyces sp. CB03238 TaxID=1907777 RepID=UPI000A122BCC|nr:DUF4259 domain-containing protein [Streptomyces sp. CB03238]ORT56606.1 hypothetical protein BKD26_27770 [Streptomyces sp. CB03238]